MTQEEFNTNRTTENPTAQNTQSETIQEGIPLSTAPSKSESQSTLSPTNQRLQEQAQEKDIHYRQKLEAKKQKRLARQALLKQIDVKYHKDLGIFAWLSIPLAYFYMMTLFEYHEGSTLALVIAGVIFVEYLAYNLQKENYLAYIGTKIETATFIVAVILQAGAITFFPFAPDSFMWLFQIIALHACFIFYVIARFGALVENELGILIFVDIFNGLIRFPLEHLGFAPKLMKNLDFKQITRKGKEASQKYSPRYVFLSIIFTIVIVSLACTQLVQLSDAFATIVKQTLETIDTGLGAIHLGKLFPNLGYLMLAIPCAIYFFSLIIGALLKTQSNELERFQSKIKPLQKYPQLTVYTVMISLCMVYALFFGISLTDLMTSLKPSAQETQQLITAHQASNMAVHGFWQLVRIALLNFSVFAAFYFIAKEHVWVNKGTRLVTTCLFLFTTLFAGLASWQLFGIYIFQFGPTEKRLLSGWFIIVLVVWCLLTLIRLYKPIKSIRYGLLFAIASFSVLCASYMPIIQHFGKK